MHGGFSMDHFDSALPPMLELPRHRFTGEGGEVGGQGSLVSGSHHLELPEFLSLPAARAADADESQLGTMRHVDIPAALAIPQRPLGPRLVFAQRSANHIDHARNMRSLETARQELDVVTTEKDKTDVALTMVAHALPGVDCMLGTKGAKLGRQTKTAA